MKQIFVLLSLILTTAFSIDAQSFNKQKLDSLFLLIEKNDKGMGSISIFQDGREVYQNSYGYADMAQKIKNNASTKFRIGSITKTFTATIVMRLIEENKLSLATKLSEFYPQIKNADKITIAHLLQHRSGIANFTSAPDYFQWNTEKHSEHQLIDRIVSGGINFEPNKKFEYSNSNYVLLTFIIEKVSGKEFSALLREMITEPCGLKDTWVGGKINPANNEALSYTKLGEWQLGKETDLSVPLGAGSIISTPHDLNLFFDCLFSEKIVKKETLEQMTTMVDRFGFGLIQVPFNEKRGYGHTGGIDGFQSNAFYFPEDKLSIALTSNGVVFPLNNIIIGALSIYFGMEYQLPQFKESIELSPEELDRYKGVYSTPQLPIKITITRSENTLIGQGTGQPSFPLDYIGNNKFKFDQAHLELEFITSENKMILKQNGMTFEMRRE